MVWSAIFMFLICISIVISNVELLCAYWPFVYLLGDTSLQVRWWFSCGGLVAKPRPTLWPTDCSPEVFSVHGISLVRILEWVAVSFSRGSSQPRDWTWVSCIGRQILFHWATGEASVYANSYIKFWSTKV